MWETPIVPLLQIWKRCGHRGPPASCPFGCFGGYHLATRGSPCIVLICVCGLCCFPGISTTHHGWVHMKTPQALGLGVVSYELTSLPGTGYCQRKRSFFLSCHCPGLEKRARPPWGTPWRTQCQRLERMGEAIGLSIISTDYLGYFWVSSSFACFGRGLLIWGLYVRPLVWVLF